MLESLLLRETTAFELRLFLAALDSKVAFVFHTLGMYSLNAVGQGKKMPMEGGWHCSQVGIQTGSDTMLMCHSMGDSFSLLYYCSLT